MRAIDWNNVQEAGDFERLPPNGYICRITAVQDVPEKEYLKLEYDIADSKYAGYFQDGFARFGFWSGSFIRSYKETAQGFFKSFLTAIKESNQGFVFNNDETALRGKRIGLVLGEEEYTKKDGTIGTRLYVDQTRTVQTIVDGKFTVPAKKLLAKPASADTGSRYLRDELEDDGMLPFSVG